MATNIVIKKLENKVFDDHVEAQERLIELGINSDVNSETYKDLAEQVRETCPCYCYFSKRISYTVLLKYSGHYTTAISYSDGYKTLTEYEITGEGVGTIQKGNSSCNVPIVSYCKTYKDMMHVPNDYNIPNFACPSLSITKNSNFSVKISDDCKHWIFSYSPSWSGQISYDVMNPDSPPSGCFEESFSFSYNTNMLQEEIYPEVTSAYPDGSMKLVYHSESQNDNLGDPINYLTDVVIEATVTPTVDNYNTLNSINSLYNELNDTLK